MIREEIEMNLVTYKSILSEMILEEKQLKKKSKQQRKAKIEAENLGMKVDSQHDYSSEIKAYNDDIILLKKLIRRYENVLSK